MNRISGLQKAIDYIEIAAHTWAVFECVGPIPEAFQKMQHTVYSEFFPSSEYQPSSGLDIQVYPTGDMQSDKYVCQLWIPIERKSLSGGNVKVFKQWKTTEIRRQTG